MCEVRNLGDPSLVTPNDVPRRRDSRPSDFHPAHRTIKDSGPLSTAFPDP